MNTYVYVLFSLFGLATTFGLTGMEKDLNLNAEYQEAVKFDNCLNSMSTASIQGIKQITIDKELAKKLENVVNLRTNGSTKFVEKNHLKPEKTTQFKHIKKTNKRKSLDFSSY